jgi:hypothetical protein
VALGAVALGAALLGGGMYAAYRVLGAAHEVVIQAASPPPSGVSMASSPPAPKPVVRVAPGADSLDETKGARGDQAAGLEPQAAGVEPKVKPVEASDPEPSADTVKADGNLGPTGVGSAKVRRSKQSGATKKSIDFGY